MEAPDDENEADARHQGIDALIGPEAEALDQPAARRAKGGEGVPAEKDNDAENENPHTDHPQFSPGHRVTQDGG